MVADAVANECELKDKLSFDVLIIRFVQDCYNPNDDEAHVEPNKSPYGAIGRISD